MKKMLDARRVQYFQQVVATGSIRGAADLLELDPSALSRAITLLEDELGMRLLERKGRGIVPTAAGQLLATYASRQMDLLTSFHEQANELKDARRGHVDLVMGKGMLDVFFDQIVVDFMREHPLVTINLVVTNTDDGVERLVNDKAHIGILYHRANDVRVRTHRAKAAIPIQAVVRRHHPLTKIGRPLRLQDLVDYPGGTVSEGFGLRQFINAAEVSEQVRLNHVLVTTSFRALWQFANAGLGYVLCGGTFAKWINMPDLVELPYQTNFKSLADEGCLKIIGTIGDVTPPVLASYPNVTQSKLLEGKDLSSLSGLMAGYYVKKGTPDDVVDRLREALIYTTQQPSAIAPIELEGKVMAKPMSAQEVADLQKAEIARYRELVKFIDFQPM